MVGVMIAKILTLFAILSIGAFSTAYAETATVEVPFDSHGQSCHFDQFAVEFHCIWQGIGEKFTYEDLEEFKDVLDQTIYNEELRKLNEQALAEIAAEKAKLTPNELIIQEIENKLNRGVATATESVYMNLLKKLDTCQQGMDRQTAPFQGAREFEISEFNQWKVNNVKYDGKLGEIVMAIEECRAQHKLLRVVGEGYSNMPTGEDDKQFSLLEHFEGVRALPFEKYTSTTTAVNESLICDSRDHSNQYKEQFGCEVLYDGKTSEQIKAENELRFGNDGKIEYQSALLGKYHEYLNNNFRYATVEHKAFENAIAEPIAKEMIESNQFHQNAMRNE
jgi:hypothetical protein